MLEKHIMQAEAKAMSADERHANREAEGQQGDLGLPIGSNHFRLVMACAGIQITPTQKLCHRKSLRIYYTQNLVNNLYLILS